MNNNAIGQSWNDFEKKFYTGEEITKSDLRVALMGSVSKSETRRN